MHATTFYGGNSVSNSSFTAVAVHFNFDLDRLGEYTELLSISSCVINVGEEIIRA